jgi:hypothetical protein
VLAAIWAMEQGRKRLWSLVHTPPRQGSAVQQAISKASTSFWSALHDLARHDRPVPAKGWDEVGPHHPFLFVRIQVPLRQCTAVAFPPYALTGCFSTALLGRRCTPHVSEVHGFALFGLDMMMMMM